MIMFIYVAIPTAAYTNFMALCLLSATPAPDHQTDGPGTFLDAALVFGLIGLVLLLFFLGLVVLVRAHFHRQKASKGNEQNPNSTDPWREAGRRVLPDDYQPKQGNDHDP